MVSAGSGSSALLYSVKTVGMVHVLSAAVAIVKSHRLIIITSLKRHLLPSETSMMY